MPNHVLRAQINDYFRLVLPADPSQREEKDAKNLVFQEFPQLIDYYIRYKEETGDKAVSISEELVKQTELRFIKQLGEFVAQLNQNTSFYKMQVDTYEETKARVLFLKDVIENKGGHKLFFANEEPIRRETDLHILFRLTWFATQSDVSREVNDGRGPVDFKISKGSLDKTLVEFKLAKNTQLKKNLEKQVEIYKKASDTKKALKVVDILQMKSLKGFRRFCMILN